MPRLTETEPATVTKGRKWWVFADDNGGIGVEPIEPHHITPHDVVYDSEAAAVDYAISCAEGRREGLADSIATLKRRRRALKRRASRAG